MSVSELCSAPSLVRRLIALVLAVLLMAFTPDRSFGQQATILVEATTPATPATQPGEAGDDEAAIAVKPQTGFSIRREDTKVLDKLADFKRHSEKKSWELAFRAVG